MTPLFSIMLLITFSTLIHPIKSQTQSWLISTTQTPTIAQATDRMAIGQYQNSIFLLGGESKNNLLEYNITRQSFINRKLTPSNNQYKYGFSTFWSQINTTLYLIDWSEQYINCLDLPTKTLTLNHFNTSIPSHVDTGACLIATTNHLYVIGSWHSSQLQIFSIFNSTWSYGPNMNEARANFACVYSTNYSRIYAIGGTTNISVKTETIEYISLQTNDSINTNWNYTNNNLAVSMDGLSAVIYNDQIFVLGGRDIYDYILDSVYIIDIASNIISIQQYDLYYNNVFGAPIVVNNILYLFGGHRGSVNGTISSNAYYWQYFDLLQTLSPTSAPTQYPTANFTFELIIYPKSLQLGSIIIVIISCFVSLIIIILFIRYLYLCVFKPRKFRYEHEIGPPSIKLLYYIQWSELFIMFFKWYIFIAQGLSWIAWNNYCNQYVTSLLMDDEQRVYGVDDYTFMTDCHNDKHCYTLSYSSEKNTKDDECNPYPGGIEAIMIVNIFAWFITFCVHCTRYYLTSPMIVGDTWEGGMRYSGESLCFLLNNSHAGITWKDGYYNGYFFKKSRGTFAIWIVTTFWFSAQTLSFSLLYNGPYLNFVPWYCIVVLIVLCILNELIKYIVYNRHVPWNEASKQQYVLYLLTNECNETLAKLIWIDFADRNKPIREQKRNEHFKQTEKQDNVQIQMQTVTKTKQ
eukprot:489385_1